MALNQRRCFPSGKLKTFMLFSVVGLSGFIVDILTMVILSHWLPAIPARIAAFWVAASSNWWLNRHLTFLQADTRNSTQQWMKFLAASCAGFIPNVGIYALLLATVVPDQFLPADLPTVLQLWPYLAMVPGIAGGLLCNYFLAERWVFRPASQLPD